MSVLMGPFIFIFIFGGIGWNTPAHSLTLTLREPAMDYHLNSQLPGLPNILSHSDKAGLPNILSHSDKVALAPEYLGEKPDLQATAEGTKADPTASASAAVDATANPPQMYSSGGTQMSAQEVLDAAKPKLHNALATHVPSFTPNLSDLLCKNVVSELKAENAMKLTSDHLWVVVNLLESAHTIEIHERIALDKDVKSGLAELAEFVQNPYGVANNGVTNDLNDYIKKLIECRLEGDKGWTMLQSIVANGLADSYQLEFCDMLQKGTDKYFPETTVDAEGNTLLHLAALSNSESMVPSVFTRQRTIYGGSRKSEMDFYYWTIGVLELKNHDGKRPLDLASSSTTINRLKQFYRNYANMLKLILKQLAHEQGLTSTANGFAPLPSLQSQVAPNVPYPLPPMVAVAA